MLLWIGRRKCKVFPLIARQIDCEQSLFFCLSSSSRGKTSRTPARRNLGEEKQEKREKYFSHFSWFSSSKFPRAGVPLSFRGSTNSREKIGTARSLDKILGNLSCGVLTIYFKELGWISTYTTSFALKDVLHILVSKDYACALTVLCRTSRQCWECWTRHGRRQRRYADRILPHKRNGDALAWMSASSTLKLTKRKSSNNVLVMLIAKCRNPLKSYSQVKKSEG